MAQQRAVQEAIGMYQLQIRDCSNSINKIKNRIEKAIAIKLTIFALPQRTNTFTVELANSQKIKL